MYSFMDKILLWKRIKRESDYFNISDKKTPLQAQLYSFDNHFSSFGISKMPNEQLCQSRKSYTIQNMLLLNTDFQIHTDSLKRRYTIQGYKG